MKSKSAAAAFSIRELLWESHTNIYPLSSVRGVVPAGSIYKKQGDLVEKI